MKRMKHRGLFFLILLIAGTGSLHAQERDDFGIWQSIDIRAGSAGKWSGGLWFEHRSKGNARTLDCAVVMPYVSFQATPHLLLDYASEYIVALSGIYISCRPSVTLMLSAGPLSFSLRELPIYEHSFATGIGYWTLRTRGKASYALPDTKLKPYMSCELFTKRHWEKTRYYIGSTWSPGKHSTLNLFYMYYVMAGMLTQRHILGLGYAFKI